MYGNVEYLTDAFGYLWRYNTVSGLACAWLPSRQEWSEESSRTSMENRDMSEGLAPWQPYTGTVPKSNADVANEILAQLVRVKPSQSAEYLEQYDAGADALRRAMGAKRDRELGLAISLLRDWNKISEWQRSVWRRNFAIMLKRKRAELCGYQVKNGEIIRMNNTRVLNPIAGLPW